LSHRGLVVNPQRFFGETACNYEKAGTVFVSKANEVFVFQIWDPVANGLCPIALKGPMFQFHDLEIERTTDHAGRGDPRAYQEGPSMRGGYESEQGCLKLSIEPGPKRDNRPTFVTSAAARATLSAARNGGKSVLDEHDVVLDEERTRFFNHAFLDLYNRSLSSGRWPLAGGSGGCASGVFLKKTTA